jgi:hypothetical protein
MIKDIYILWFQGFDNAPIVVKKCLASWKHHNPDWNIIELDDTNLSKYIDISMYRHINLTALSDIVRIFLLNKFGGLWVDATTFCNIPLNNWLEEYITEGFFTFNWPTKHIYHKIATWFIYSEKNGYLINNWEKAVIKYYTFNFEPTKYFWVHELFGELYIGDRDFKSLYNKTKKISTSEGPYTFKSKWNNTITKVDRKIIDSAEIKLYKMTYKNNMGIINPNSIAEYLFFSINRHALLKNRQLLISNFVTINNKKRLFS